VKKVDQPVKNIASSPKKATQRETGNASGTASGQSKGGNASGLASGHSMGGNASGFTGNKAGNMVDFFLYRKLRRFEVQGKYMFAKRMFHIRE
jgi:hypothetical protein